MTFPHLPIVITINGRGDRNLTAWQKMGNGVSSFSSGNNIITFSWDEENKTVTWGSGDNDNYNRIGYTHRVVCLLDLDK